jgi:hypothetical protein
VLPGAEFIPILPQMQFLIIHCFYPSNMKKSNKEFLLKSSIVKKLFNEFFVN